MTQKVHNMLSIIVPVYKQERVIARNLRLILRHLDTLSTAYELIAVVDGIVDRSMQEAKKVTSPHISVTGYKTNHGKGYAIRFGMAQSHGDIIGFIDAGGDIGEEGLAMMLEHFRWYNADVIIGSKRHPVSKVHYPWQRKILSWGYQILVRVLFGLHIRDSQVGMKLYRRVVLEDVLPRLLVKQFAFDIEILAVANRLGYARIYEAPVELTFQGASSITSQNFWRIVINVLWETLAVFYRLRILHYYDNTNKRKWRFDPELNFKVNVG
ncbi:glycosyltransferase [Candidatus Gottesmanbacteria bacterium]|nr:glycosyltransferase [Candidatus Gottesmanbacteria bacterium]